MLRVTLTKLSEEIKKVINGSIRVQIRSLLYLHQLNYPIGSTKFCLDCHNAFHLRNVCCQDLELILRYKTHEPTCMPADVTEIPFACLALIVAHLDTKLSECRLQFLLGKALLNKAYCAIFM